MTTSAILGIPYISGQQSQPEITHNEALNMLQTMVSVGALSVGDNTPPGSPAEGDIYVIGTAPTGAWAGRENAIAGYLSGQWVFVPGNDSSGTPIEMGADQEGLKIWNKSDDTFYIWTDKNLSPGLFAWQELNLPAVPDSDFGELTVTDNSTSLSVTAAVDTTLLDSADYTQITGIFDAIPHGVNNGVTQQTNSFTIAADGDYAIFVWCNVTSNVNNTTVGLKFAINGAVGVSRRPKALIKTSGEYLNMGARGFVSLQAGDVVTLYHAADKTSNITYQDLVFGVEELRRA